MREDKLSKAAAEAAKVMNQTIYVSEIEEREFSDGFERKMRRLINRVKHPVIYEQLRKAICFILILAVCGGTVLLFDVEVRAVVLGWIKEKYESFMAYHHSGTLNTLQDLDYELGWIPNEYTLFERKKMGGITAVIYVNSDRDELQFSYSKGGGMSSLFMDESESDIRTVAFDECIADVYLAKDKGKYNSIVWSSQDKEVLFFISSLLEEDELVKMAQSVKIAK